MRVKAIIIILFGFFCDLKYREFLEYAKFGAYNFECYDNKRFIGIAFWDMHPIDLKMMIIFKTLEQNLNHGDEYDIP